MEVAERPLMDPVVKEEAPPREEKSITLFVVSVRVPTAREVPLTDESPMETVPPLRVREAVWES